MISCIEDEPAVVVSELRFSADTVLFDTVFSTVGSTTKRLRVYNDREQPVLIPQVRIAGGPASPYRVIFNGNEGGSFNDIEILPGDSALVLISVTIDPRDEDLPFIVKDSLVFESDSRSWDVDLVAWGQDAWFFSDSVLNCNSTWTAGRPYVIYNSVLIDTLCQLTIEPGVEIYSHTGSAIFVKGSLVAQGTAEERILFRNDRLDENYENAAGQWDGIYYLEGSANNLLEFTDIRNSVLGIRVGSPDDDTDPDIIMRNSTIENTSAYGVLAFTSDLLLENCLVNNCQLGNVAAVAGGNYSFIHCTFANYPLDFLFGGPSVVFSDNVELANNQLLEADLDVLMQNCVVWGLQEDELFVSTTGNNQVSFDLFNNLIRSGLDLPGNLVNQDPLFTDPYSYLYVPDEGSPLIDAATDVGLSTDVYGNPRDAAPDIGAIEKQ